MSHTRVATHCPHCAVQCGMGLVVDERRRVKVARDFPVDRGGLCQKGGRHDDQPRGEVRPAADGTGAANGRAHRPRSENVYAVGECVQHRGEVYGLAAPIWEQAFVLADRITGADPAAEYCDRSSPPSSRWPASSSRGVYKAAIVRDGKVVCGILLGDLAKASFLTQAFDCGTVLPH